MIKAFIYGAVLCALLTTKPSLALGQLGHKIVCQLAFDHLPTLKQQKITTLLNTIPKRHKRLINRYNHHKKDQTITFANACTWADAIKHNDVFRQYNTWHYMNVARSQTKVNVNDCRKNCLPQAILKHQQALANNRHVMGTWQQAQALLFLGHWLGDIHQPLHISFKDDLGGNRIMFSQQTTKCSNLHWYWDNCILFKGKQSKRQWLKLLTKQWQHTSQPTWQADQVWQWANESFQMILEPRFNYCVKNAQGRCEKPLNKINLPPDYLLYYQGAMEQRLLQAAQRLAQVLNASL